MRELRAVRLGSAIAFLGLVACQAPVPVTGSAGPSTAPVSAPSPTPAHTAIAVLDTAGSTSTLRLVTLDGRQLASAALAPDAVVVGAGSDMAMYVDSGSSLRGLRTDGAVVTLGTLTNHSGPVAVSPSGGAWMWATLTGQFPYSTSIVLSTRGEPDRTVASMGPSLLGLRAFRWTPGGPVYTEVRLGTDYYGPFGVPTEASWRVDSQTNQVTPLLSSTCPIADLAADGSIACFPSATPSSPVRSIRLQLAGSPPRDIALPSSTFDRWGAASFKPDSQGTIIALGGGTFRSPGSPASDQHFQIHLVDARTGILTPFGPTGLEPADGSWAWLPDGSLLAYRQAGVSGGDPGVIAVAPDGGTHRVFPSGIPVGALSLRRV